MAQIQALDPVQFFGQGLQRRLQAFHWLDARHGQLLILGSLLLFAVHGLDFTLRPYAFPTLVAVCLATQALGAAATGARFEPRSALITSFSLTLLFRADGLEWLALAGILAIGSKFVLRANGRHIFNPANFAIALLLLLVGQEASLGGWLGLGSHVWITPGQWGTVELRALAIAAGGCMVLTLAGRADTALAFIGTYAGLLFARHLLWLGDPVGIPLNTLSSGSLIIFTCFMITDPRTTPERRSTRILWAAAVALATYALQFTYTVHAGAPIYALIALSPLVPLINRLWPGVEPDWRRLGPSAAGSAAVPASRPA